ncbi:MAG: DMT family transporter [Pseudomonadota bacterium]
MLLYVKLILAACFWGGTFVAGRMASMQSGPFSIAFLRFAIASILLLLYVRKRNGSIPILHNGRDIVNAIILALTGIFAYNALFFTALQTVHASRAAVIVANNPIVIAICAAIFLKEPFSWLKGVGIVVSVCGTLIAITHGELNFFASHPFTMGDLILLGCLASWATYSVYGKTAMKGMSPLSAVTWSCTFGAIMLFPFALYEGMASHLMEYSLTFWASVVYLAVFGTVLGFTWFYEAVKEIGAARAGAFINFVPLTAILFGWLFLGEPISISLLVGTSLVICGVYVANRH